MFVTFVMFLKLNFVPLDEDNEAAGGTYIFQPSEHRINEFCEMMDIYKESIDSNKISRLQKKMMIFVSVSHLNWNKTGIMTEMRYLRIQKTRMRMK